MRMIVILSSERSGSTLVRVLLGQHDRIVAPGELWLMCYEDYVTWRRQRPTAIDSVLEYFSLIGKPQTQAAIDHACEALKTPDVCRWMLGFLEEGQLLVDKTPAYANSLDRLNRARAVQPFFIWLIRHPMAVVDSHLRLRQSRRHQSGIGAFLHVVRDQVENLSGGGVKKIARDRESKWVTQHTNIRRFLSDIPEHQKHVLHFEDLVAAPKQTMANLCRAIGLELQADMLQMPEGMTSLKPGLGDPTFGGRDRIDQSAAFQWTGRLAGTALAEETRALMQQIGVREAAGGKV